jgi:hypothetical protein
MSTHDEALDRLLSGQLPVPSRARFQPLRLGLIGIWEYDEQQFVFHDGRLILRGRNGSGKTKVLEVSSPFLFDGILQTRRLDPFGNAARPMRDNLLYKGRTHRVGYVWCEYGRVDQGEYQFLTIGAGLRAQTTKKGTPESWFFVTSQRVGRDFSLYDSGRFPLGQSQLADLLGKEAVMSKAKDYQTKVARDLFGFSRGQLRSLVELLLTLRRPKLSEDLSVEKLQELLRDGLPPVNGTILDGLATRFDELAREHDGLRSLQQTRHDVDRFLAVYRVFARRVVRGAAESVLSAGDLLAQTKIELDKARRRLADERKRADRLHEQREKLTGRLDGENARLSELLLQPGVAEHERVEELSQRVAAALTRKLFAKGQERDAEERQATDERDAAELEGRLGAELIRLEAAEKHARELADATILDLAHRSEADAIRQAPEAVGPRLFGQVDARLRSVREAAPLVAAVTEAETKLRLITGFHEDVERKRDDARQSVQTAETEHLKQVDELCDRITEWSSRCTELNLTTADLDGLLAHAHRIGTPGAPPISVVLTRLAKPFETALADEEAVLRAEVSGLATTRAELIAHREHIASGPEPQPGPSTVTRRDRTGADDGAPFWAIVDFRPDIDHQGAARVEAALTGAGILDAWITRDGAVLDQSLDAFLHLETMSSGTGTLVDVLRPAPCGFLPDRARPCAPLARFDRLCGRTAA